MKSRYSITTEKLGPDTLYTLQDNINGERVSVLPVFGGLINSIILSCASTRIEILDGYSSNEELKRELPRLFKGCSLFPFPNRVNLGRYCFEGREYSLPVNFPQERNAIHGLVFDKEFQVESLQANKNNDCSLKLVYVSDGMEGYPFSFKIVQNYCLHEESGLIVKTEIVNRSSGPIPVGQGWHPYFNLGTSSIDTLCLKVPGNKIFAMNQRNIPTKEMCIFDKFSKLEEIGPAILDSCYKVQTNDAFADTFLCNNLEKTVLRIRQQTGDNGYNFLQIFTPPGRGSIAIEPMSCAPDAFNNGHGLIRLESGGSISLSWEVKLLTREDAEV